MFYILLFSLLLPAAVCHAQPDSTRTAAPRDTVGRSTTGTKATHWYDTLQVTRPRYARITPMERLALSAFTALALPVGIAIGATTLLPPSINVLVDDGAVRTGVTISTGLGFGIDTDQVIFFPTWRLQGEAGYYFGGERGPVARVSALFDKPLGSIHPRDFFWAGVAGGAGVSTDFASLSPYVEGWVGVMNPMGIRFLTLFPMHNYGVRGRVGYAPADRRPWYELSLCATSTFW
jgi:hypothetical protein